MDSNHDNQLQRLVSYQLDDPGNDGSYSADVHEFAEAASYSDLSIQLLNLT